MYIVEKETQQGCLFGIIPDSLAGTVMERGAGVSIHWEAEQGGKKLLLKKNILVHERCDAQVSSTVTTSTFHAGLTILIIRLSQQLQPQQKTDLKARIKPMSHRAAERNETEAGLLSDVLIIPSDTSFLLEAFYIFPPSPRLVSYLPFSSLLQAVFFFSFFFSLTSKMSSSEDGSEYVTEYVTEEEIEEEEEVEEDGEEMVTVTGRTTENLTDYFFLD